MLACVVFKANCQPGYPCVDGNTMITGMVVAFFAHILLHTLTLKFVVPKFGLVGESDGAETNTYQDCSRSQIAPFVFLFFHKQPETAVEEHWFVQLND